MPQVNEQVSALVTGQFRKDNDDLLPYTTMSTITMTLYDKVTGAIINSRDHVNIFNTGGGTLDALGYFTLILAPEDNVILNPAVNLQELHVLLLEWTYEGGTKKGKQEILIGVKNLQKVA